MLNFRGFAKYLDEIADVVSIALMEGLNDGQILIGFDQVAVNIQFAPIIHFVSLISNFTLIFTLLGHSKDVLQVLSAVFFRDTPLVHVRLQLSPRMEMVDPGGSFDSGQIPMMLVQTELEILNEFTRAMKIVNRINYLISQQNNINRVMDQSQPFVDQSIGTQLDDPKNSRILNRKQIQKRLQNLKPGQYERISSNLLAQNKRLKQQVRNLHEKVQQLIIAKKIPDLKMEKNPLIEEQIKKTKKQLALKYESMNYLKEQVRKNQQNQLTEEMKIGIREQMNDITNIEREIKELNKQKMKLMKMIELNTESLEEYHPSANKEDNKDEMMNNLKEENKEMKAKISEFYNADKSHLKTSKQVLDKFYGLKEEEQRYMKAIMESKNSRKKITMNDLKTIDTSEVSVLQNEIESLKNQKKQAEKQLVNEKIIKEQRKAKLEKEARDLMDQHKQLLRRRMKALNQLNLFEAKDKKQKEYLETKIQSIKVELIDKSSQTDKIIPKDFRREWIGKSEGVAFDDSLILDYKSQVSIKSVIIYKNAEHIGFIKFFYENSQKKRYESKVPFDVGILRKFESKKHVAKGNSFLKGFNCSLTSDKITKVQMIWSDGTSVVEGWDNEGSVQYQADIGSDEKPVSMFGTIKSHGKNVYALESLGCQVNRIDQSD